MKDGRAARFAEVVRLFSHTKRVDVENALMFHRLNHHSKIDPTAMEVSEARFKRFLKEFDAYERKLTFQRTLDAFLDLYSAWKKSRDKALKLRLVMLAFELHRLDEAFECDLSFQDGPHAGNSR